VGIIYNMSFAAHLMKHRQPVKSSARVSKKVQPSQQPKKSEKSANSSTKVGFNEHGFKLHSSKSPEKEKDFYGRGGSKKRNKTMRKRKTRKN
jgi:hypothetical protein